MCDITPSFCVEAVLCYFSVLQRKLWDTEINNKTCCSDVCQKMKYVDRNMRYHPQPHYYEILLVCVSIFNHS